MKIGIIGAGNIGGNLTRRLTALGHDVTVANSRGPATLGDLVAETGATAVPVTEGSRDAEVVIVTIPEGKIPDLPVGFLDGAAPGAVVLDTGNYYPQQRDGRITAIEEGATESRWVADQLGVDVVKVFNGIYADQLLGGAGPREPPTGVRCPSRVTTLGPRRSSWGCSTSSASTVWTPVVSTSRGGSSPARPSTAPAPAPRGSSTS